MIVFPVRHHSPAAALALAAHIRRQRPRLILVEGPADATPLIPLLLAPDTRPPVAVLAYYPAAEGSEPRSSLWPFCAYSPEYVALQVGQEVEAELRFCDVPAGWSLKNRVVEESSGEGAGTQKHARTTLYQELAARFGFATFDEFWDACFEMRPGEGFSRQMAEYGHLVRGATTASSDGAFNAVREAYMRTSLRQALAEGYAPDEILVVVGAAHAEAFATFTHAPDEAESSLADQDTTLLAPFEATPPARLTLIPYSFPRLAEQLGYGAGNRAPAYYQAVWEAGGDFAVATRCFLLSLLHRLQGAGYAVSLADAIEAERLAVNLAGLRNKPLPGLEELHDAAVATYGRGNVALIWPHLNALLVGETIGTLSSQVEKTSLQQEFHDTVKRLGIPFSDSPKEYRLDLTGATDVEASIFLHRLLVLEVPFATWEKVGGLGRPLSSVADEGFLRLAGLREKWMVQWSPLVDVRLIEATIFGTTLREACGYLLGKQLAAADNVGEAASTLLSIVLADVDELFTPALAAVDTTSSQGSDLPALARAANALHLLVKYGAARRCAPSLFADLLERVFVRAALLLPDAAVVGDDAVKAVADGVKLLHELAGSSPFPSDREASGQGLPDWLLSQRLYLVAESEAAHPTLAGLAATLLYLSGDMDQAAVRTLLSRYLSPGEEPLRGAQFLEGFLALNRLVLLRNPEVVGWLNDYLQALDNATFISVLPILRRTLADLSPAELNYLIATLARVLELETPPLLASITDQATLEELSAIDRELAELLEEL